MLTEALIVRLSARKMHGIRTDSLRHGNGLSALLLLTRAAKSSAAKSSAAKTRSTEIGLKGITAVIVGG